MSDAESIQEQVLEIGTRLTSSPSDCLIESAFAWELSHQQHLFEAIGLVDLAHTFSTMELGTIPRQQGVELLASYWICKINPSLLRRYRQAAISIPIVKPGWPKEPVP